MTLLTFTQNKLSEAIRQKKSDSLADTLTNLTYNMVPSDIDARLFGIEANRLNGQFTDDLKTVIKKSMVETFLLRQLLLKNELKSIDGFLQEHNEN